MFSFTKWLHDLSKRNKKFGVLSASRVYYAFETTLIMYEKSVSMKSLSSNPIGAYCCDPDILVLFNFD